MKLFVSSHSDEPYFSFYGLDSGDWEVFSRNFAWSIAHVVISHGGITLTQSLASSSRVYGKDKSQMYSSIIPATL